MHERLVEQLKAHPDLVKHASGYTNKEISALTDRGERIFQDPITITNDDLVLEGYALWQLARLQKRRTVRCIVREMSKEQALIHIIGQNLGSKGINDFVRILLALELEPWFKEQAKKNQRNGGREKGSSQLTEAHRLDVRLEIARAAGVSVGNVSKVKLIMRSAELEVQEALRQGEISISRGAAWATIRPAEQHQRLTDGRRRRGIHKTIGILLKKHQPAHPHICDGLRDIQRGFRRLQQDDCLLKLSDSISGVIRDVDLLLTNRGGRSPCSVRSRLKPS